jgi:hypothetical protein
VPVAGTPAAARHRPGRRLRLVAVIVLAAIPAACDAVAPAPSPSPTPLASGVRGRVVISAACEPSAPAQAVCFEPFVARLVVLDADGQVVGETTSAPDGAFEILLPPGSYTIAPVPAGEPYPTASLLAVSVVEEEMTEVEVRYDSGTGGEA